MKVTAARLEFEKHDVTTIIGTVSFHEMSTSSLESLAIMLCLRSNALFLAPGVMNLAVLRGVVLDCLVRRLFHSIVTIPKYVIGTASIEGSECFRHPKESKSRYDQVLWPS